MSTTPMAPGTPRVRHQARQAVVVMAFSAATSVALAVGLLLLVQLGQGV